MNPRISIIVPVYNAEKYLPKCIKSIQKQTFCDYMVLLVDDGSTDDSFRIIENYRSLDNRVLLYRQEHCGVSAARNVGLKNAKGDYICFVDADDQIAPTYLENLYLSFDNYIDSSMCGFKKIDLLSGDDCLVVPEKRIETLEENLFGFYNSSDKDWQRYLWNRMFKRSIIESNHLRFNESIYYKEDGLFVVQYLCLSNGLVGCVDKVLYYYYRNTTGAMSKTWYAFDAKVITNLDAHRMMIEAIKQKKVSDAILLMAKTQAKAACNWILQLMSHNRTLNLFLVLRIENIMFSILGFREYLSWRISQIRHLLK